MTQHLPEAARPTADGASPTITYAAAGLLGLLPFSTDVFLTAMVDVGRDFHATMVEVQPTMLAFTLGFALAHLFIGRLADLFGRRPVALGGLAVFLLASIAAVLAPTLALLIAARFVQGLTAAAGPIIARTLVRDTVPPDLGGRALAKVGALYGMSPLIAPTVGTLATQAGGWRAALAVLIGYGIVLAVILWMRLPETRPSNVHGAEQVSILRALRHCIRTRAFVVGCLAVACAYGVLFSWLTTSAFLMVNTLGMTKLQASYVYTAGAVGFLSGGMAAMRLAKTWIPRHLLRIAAALIVIGTVAPFLALEAGYASWPVLVVTLLPYYLGWGLAQPMATSIAMRPFPEMAGQASAWVGMAQQLGGIVFALLAAALGGGMGTLVVMMLAAVGFAVSVFLPVQKPVG